MKNTPSQHSPGMVKARFCNERFVMQLKVLNTQNARSLTRKTKRTSSA